LRNGNYQVRGLKKTNAVTVPSASERVEWSSAKLTSEQDVKDIFQGCEAAFMFITPADLSEVTSLTRSLLRTGV
jgi:nitric-oxide synthase